MFKSQNKWATAFGFKDWILKNLASGVVYKFQCGLYNESYYRESVRHLNARIGKHIRISALAKKKNKPEGRVVSDYLLLCDHSPSFETFSVLTKDNRKSVLELKENTLMMRDEPSLHRNIRSAQLYLFDRVQLRFAPLFGSSILGFF